MFSCEFCKISKNTFPYRTPPVATSVETFIRTELLVMPLMPHTACCINPWLYYFIKFQLSFFKRNYKMMESEICSWKYFHYNWMNLVKTHASQQLDSSKLSMFVLLLLKLRFRIKFELLQKTLNWRHSQWSFGSLFGYHFHHLLVR